MKMKRLLVLSLFVFFGFVNVSIAQALFKHEVFKYTKEGLIRDVREFEGEVVSIRSETGYGNHEVACYMAKQFQEETEIMFSSNIIDEFVELFIEKAKELSNYTAMRTINSSSGFKMEVANFPDCTSEVSELSRKERKERKTRYKYLVITECSMTKDKFIENIETIESDVIINIELNLKISE